MIRTTTQTTTKTTSKTKTTFLGCDTIELNLVDLLYRTLEMIIIERSTIIINIFINTQVELKKLRFHTVDEKGKSKCSVMHVGKPSTICPQLEVHGTPMNSIASTKYLGDIVAADAKNDLNVQNRVAKGMGNIT